MLQEEVNRLQKQLVTSQEKAARSRKDHQEKTDHLARIEKSYEKQRKEFDKLKTSKWKLFFTTWPATFDLFH